MTRPSPAGRPAKTADADWLKRVEILRQQGQIEAALAACEAGLAREPFSIQGRLLRGILRGSVGAFADGIADLDVVLQRLPQVAGLHLHRADMLVRLSRYEEARQALTRALALEPDNRAAAASLAGLLQRLGEPQAAHDAYARALRLDPHNALLHANLAGLLLGFGALTAAAEAAATAIGLMPGLGKAHLYHAEALRRLGRSDAALEACRQALAVAPGATDVLALLCDLRQQACDWPGLAEQQAALLARPAADRSRIAVFPLLAMTDDPAAHLRSARIWAEGLPVTALSAAPPAPVEPRPAESRGTRLRVGYLSADFRHHAVAMLIAEVLERHDRGRFAIFAYSTGRDDGSPMRRRLMAAVDHFVDLAGASDAAAAHRIRGDAIDILIDLTGYTTAARSAIPALRPAPIQVNYLGYPGTMGASFMDYILVDARVVPAEAQTFYDERLVHLPNCYQPNDSTRPCPAVAPPRAAFGLPEAAFVFCCFNNAYKINPAMFDIWMRLLGALPGAVLWLLQSNGVVAANLRREAAARGIDPDRLHFAPLVDTETHLLRHLCADLFLDTLPYNAHTTASDALWTGLPVLTLPGRAFAGRVAASLLQAAGLPELIATSAAEYEAIALRLARTPAELGGLQARLKANRRTAPLFDAVRSTRALEAAYLHMAALHAAGEAPRGFAVEHPTRYAASCRCGFE